VAEPRVLITGCGRSGTSFVTALLRALGEPVRKEGRAAVPGEGTPRDSNTCWYCCMLFEPNVAQNENITRCGCRFPGVGISATGESLHAEPASITDHYDIVLHQVRTPLDTIASSLTFTPGSWRYIDNKLGVNALDDPILRAVRYWIDWNAHAARIAHATHRLEDLEDELPSICEHMQIRHDREAARAIFDRGPLNARPHGPVTADDIGRRSPELLAELRHHAARYGYDL
jgi:hypothetical protein